MKQLLCRRLNRTEQGPCLTVNPQGMTPAQANVPATLHTIICWTQFSWGHLTVTVWAWLQPSSQQDMPEGRSVLLQPRSRQHQARHTDQLGLPCGYVFFRGCCSPSTPYFACMFFSCSSCSFVPSFCLCFCAFQYNTMRYRFCTLKPDRCSTAVLAS